MEIVTSTQPPRNDGDSVYTCNTCGLSFPTADLQRLHMKTDWHRYNLKRKVANLPPITSEMFAEKMLQQQQMQEMQKSNTGRGSSARSTGQRQQTKRDKKKEEKLMKKMAQAHISGSADNSNIPEHRPGSPAMSEASMSSSTFSLGEPVEVESSHGGETEDDEYDDEGMNTNPVNHHEDTETETENEDEEEERLIQEKISKAVKIPPNVCFVDGTEFDTVEDNVKYMERTYGLFIPEKEYLIDLHGLIEYLGEKIGLGKMCLYCNYESRTLEGVRQHLRGKNHVKIPYETTDQKLEISDFYDFRSSYGDKKRKNKSKSKKKSKAEATGNDEGWEDVDDEDFEDGEEGEVIQIEEDEESSSDEELDEDEDTLYVDDSGYQLELASGYRAGHRSLAHFYKQNLRPSTVTREGQGTVMAVDRRASNLVKPKDPVQAKLQKQAWKEEKKQRDLHVKRDKHINFQPHFRDPLLQ